MLIKNNLLPYHQQPAEDELRKKWNKQEESIKMPDVGKAVINRGKDEMGERYLSNHNQIKSAPCFVRKVPSRVIGL